MSLYYVTLFRTFATPATRPERNVLTNSLRRFRDHRWQIAPHEQPNKRKERQRSHLNVRQWRHTACLKSRITHLNSWQASRRTKKEGFEEEETADHQTHSGCGTPPPPISRERADWDIIRAINKKLISFHRIYDVLPFVASSAPPRSPSARRETGWTILHLSAP